MQLFDNVWHQLTDNLRIPRALVNIKREYEFKTRKYLKSSDSAFKVIKYAGNITESRSC